MNEPKRIMAELDWTGGLRFLAGKPDGPHIALDGDGVEAPSPVIALLCAAGGCSGADVVSILEKTRLILDSVRLELGRA